MSPLGTTGQLFNPRSPQGSGTPPAWGRQEGAPVLSRSGDSVGTAPALGSPTNGTSFHFSPCFAPLPTAPVQFPPTALQWLGAATPFLTK